MERTRRAWSREVVIVTAFLVMTGHDTPVLGYRPFVSTDAAVVDPGEVELELGYFNLERAGKENVFVVPQVSGESIKEKIPNDSVLLGIIWQPPSSSVLLDGGVRKSLSTGAPDWLFTTGLTWSFPLASTYGGRP